MITLQTQVVTHPDVIATALSNQEMVLLHMATQQYYTLNETGTQIWEGVAKAQSLAEIGQGLEMRYDIDLAQAEQQVVALVTGLAAEDLIQVVRSA